MNIQNDKRTSNDNGNAIGALAYRRCNIQASIKVVL